MEDKAHELYWKYLNSHSLMSKNAAKICASLEIEGRVEELTNLPGTKTRIKELKNIEEKIWSI